MCPYIEKPEQVSWRLELMCRANPGNTTGLTGKVTGLAHHKAVGCDLDGSEAQSQHFCITNADRWLVFQTCCLYYVQDYTEYSIIMCTALHRVKYPPNSAYTANSIH
jgi:hypothetical protein